MATIPVVIEGLERLRRSTRRLLVLRASALLGLAIGLGIAAIGLIDFAVRLPAFMRLLLLVPLAAGAVWLIRTQLRPALAYRPTLVDLALRIERSRPDLAGRLASAVEFAQSGVLDRNALARLSADRLAEAFDAAYDQHVERRPLVRSGSAFGGMLFVTLVVAVAAPAFVGTGLQRVLLPWTSAAWPARTAVASLMADVLAAPGVHPRGEVLPLRARNLTDGGAEEAVTAHVRVQREGRFGAWTTATLTHQGDGVHERLFDGAAEAVEVYFATSDARTDTETITLVPPPAVVATSLAVTPPTYAEGLVEPLDADLGTGVDARARTDQPALVGSSATLAVTFNKPLDAPDGDARDAWVATTFGVDPDAVAVTARDAQTWELAWTVTERSVLSMEPRDAFGLGPREPIQFVVDAVEDLAPRATMMEPERDERALPGAVIPLRAEATDDVGLRRVAVEVLIERPGGEPFAAALSGDVATALDRPSERRPRDEVSAPLELEPLELQAGDIVLVRALAEDVFEPADGRPVAKSAPRRIRIIDETDFGTIVRRDLALVRQEAIRLEDRQRELQNEVLRGDADFETARAQAELTERIASQRASLDRIAQRIRANRLDDEPLEQVIDQSSDLLDFAGRAANDALARLEAVAATGDGGTPPGTGAEAGAPQDDAGETDEAGQDPAADEADGAGERDASDAAREGAGDGADATDATGSPSGRGAEGRAGTPSGADGADGSAGRPSGTDAPSDDPTDPDDPGTDGEPGADDRDDAAEAGEATDPSADADADADATGDAGEAGAAGQSGQPGESSPSGATPAGGETGDRALSGAPSPGSPSGGSPTPGSTPEAGTPEGAEDAEDRPSETTDEAARAAAEAQQTVRDELGDLIELLDRDEDTWLVRQQLSRLVEGQRELEDRTAGLSEELIGRDVSDLTAGERAALDEIAEEQRGLAESFDRLVEEMRRRADAMAEADPDAADGLEAAADEGETREAGRSMRDAAEAAEANQLQNAGGAQARARETLERMQQTLEENRGVQTEELLRQLASLLESIDRLITVQERELIALARAETPADFNDRARGMIRLAQNTGSVAGDARTAGQEVRRVARVLDRARTAQEDAITVLRSDAPDVVAIGEAEERALARLNEARDLAAELEEQAEEEQVAEARQELVTAYAELFEREIALRAATLELADARPLGRRERQAARRLGNDQEAIRSALEELLQSSEDLTDSTVFRYVHELLDAWSGEVRDALYDAEVGLPVTERQRRIAEAIRQQIAALEELAAQEQEFAEEQAGNEGQEGGGNQGGQTPPPVLPPAAELVRLRQLQETVYRETRTVDETGDLDPADRAGMVDELGRIQQDILDLGERMLEQLMQQAGGGGGGGGDAPPDPSTLPIPPDGATDPGAPGAAGTPDVPEASDAPDAEAPTP